MTYPDPELGLVTMGGIPLVVDDELEHDRLEVDRGPAGQVVELRAHQHVVDRILDALRQPSTLNPQPDIETPEPSTLNPRPRLEAGAGDDLVLELEVDTSARIVELAASCGLTLESWQERWLEQVLAEAHARANELLLAAHAPLPAAELARLRDQAAHAWARDTPLDVLVLAPDRRVSVHDFERSGTFLARDVSGPPWCGPPPRSGS